MECDALIIDFEYLTTNSSRSGGRDFFLKRKKDLEDFITYKDTALIYFVPAPLHIPVIVGSHMQNLPFDFFAPIPQINPVPESGSKLNVIPKTIFTDFFNLYKEYFSYRVVLESNYGTTIAETPLRKKQIAFYNENAVFLPALTKPLKEVEEPFLKELTRLAKLVRLGTDKSPLPSWTDTLNLPGEENLKKEIIKINGSIEKLNEELEQKRNGIDHFKGLKRLFTASGKELEFEVEKIFRELGFEILETENGRDDLIVKYDEQIAVVEIKGVSKSAAESHAAQLEKWAATYLEEKEVMPKPILIVNAFKDLPLNERVQPAFPEQMLKYSKQRNNCLITTLQLATLLFAIENNDISKESAITILLETTGPYAGELKWQSYITLT